MASKKTKTPPPSPALGRRRRRFPRLAVGLLLTAALIGGISGYLALRPTAPKYYRHGYELARAGQGAAAAIEWRKAIQLDPTYAPPFLALAAQAEQAADFAAAIRTLETLYRNNPKVPYTLSHLAQLYGMTNRFETALATARKAVQVEPNDSNAHNALGMLLEMADDHRHAAEALGEAHRLSPDDETLILDYARVLARAGQADKAFPLVEQVRHNVDTPFAIQADYLMAWLLAEYGKHGKPDPDEALKYLLYMLKYEPNQIACNTEVGLIYERQGKDREALPYLERATQNGPTNVEAIQALARVYLRLHRPEGLFAMQSAQATDKAVIALRKARNRYVTHPEDKANLRELAELEANIGNSGDALELRRRVKGKE